MTGKKINKWISLQNKKWSISCKKYAGNSNIVSKTIDNKVKTKRLKCKHEKSMSLKQMK